MKKILTLVAALSLVASLAVGGSIAYLQDTDQTVNVMTIGNVEIDQLELQRAEGVEYDAHAKDGDLVPYQQGKKLYPAYAATDDAYTAPQSPLFYWGPYVTAESDGTNGAGGAGNGLWDTKDELIGAIDKMVFVENTGTSECYYRTIIAFECPEGMEYSSGADKEFMMNVNLNARFDWSNVKDDAGNEVEYVDIGGVRYLVVVATYQNVLPAGTISRPSLLQVVMTHNADNEDMAKLGDSYEILTLSQACQTENFPDVNTALNAAFGELTVENVQEWFDGMEAPAAYAVDASSLKNALAKGGNISVTEDIELDGTVEVPADKAVTLNLGDKSLSVDQEDGSIVIRNSGDLTLTNGTVNGGLKGYAVYSDSGSVTVKRDAVIQGAFGAMNLNGGTEAVIESGAQLSTEGRSGSSSHVIYVNGGSKLTIEDATVTHEGQGADGSVLYVNNGEVVVNGGTFTASGSAYGPAVSTNGTLIINGGTFENGLQNWGGTITITGGTFKKDPSSYVADGYKAVQNGSTWTVYPNDVVTSDEELDAALTANKTNISLAAGTYHMPASAQGKTLTISGSKDAIIEVVPAGQGEANGQLDYNLDGSTVTFNGVTIKTNSQLYAGFARLSGTYNDCVIQNTYNLGTGNSEFNNCVINITNEYLRVGGAYSAEFNACTFNTDGRAILVFQDGTSVAQTVTVKDCTFNATAAANTWNGIHVAAVSIDGTNGTYVVNLEGNNTVDSDFNGLWQIKAGEANVTVNE